jgi:succinylarginine dihydrolase
VVDQDVFYNDVITVSNHNVMFHHQQAFYHQQRALELGRHKIAMLVSDLIAIKVPTQRGLVAAVVAIYLFNS